MLRKLIVFAMISAALYFMPLTLKAAGSADAGAAQAAAVRNSKKQASLVANPGLILDGRKRDSFCCGAPLGGAVGRILPSGPRYTTKLVFI